MPRHLTEKDERRLISEHMRRVGHTSDKKHMSEIGKKGFAAMVHNLLERAKR